VISAGLLGFGIDKVFDTQPWAFLGFMIIGLVYAVFLAQRTMNPAPDHSDPPEANDTAIKKDEEKP